jgi:hypothetical protein
MVGRAAVRGATAAVLTGVAAEVVGGVVVAGAVEGAGGVSGLHAAHRQVNSRQHPAARDFAPILRGCRGLIFDERGDRASGGRAGIVPIPSGNVSGTIRA